MSNTTLYDCSAALLPPGVSALSGLFLTWMRHLASTSCSLVWASSSSRWRSCSFRPSCSWSEDSEDWARSRADPEPGEEACWGSREERRSLQRSQPNILLCRWRQRGSLRLLNSHCKRESRNKFMKEDLTLISQNNNSVNLSTGCVFTPEARHCRWTGETLFIYKYKF